MKTKNLSIILTAAMLAASLSGMTAFAEEEITGISTSVTSGYTGNIFYDKEPVKLNVNFKNNDKSEEMLDASYTITDGEGREIAAGEFEEVSLGGGEENEQKVYLGAMDYDTYMMNITNGEKTESFRFSSSVKSKSQNNDDVMGVCTHLRRNIDIIPEVTQLIDNAGITWIRDEYYWDAVEKEKGVYNFYADGYIDSVIEKGNNVLVILDYGNELYGGVPHDETGYNAYAEYCRAMAEHLKGKVDTFEIWNEWNGSFGGGYGPEEYGNMLKCAAKAIKEVNPDAYIVACASADVDMGWIEKVINIAGIECMDAISAHPYAYPSSPESGGLKSNIAKIHDLAKKYGKDIDVWCTEMGYPASTKIMDETTAGAYKSRVYIYGKTLKGRDKLFLYDFQNDGVNSANSEHNFGMIRAAKEENVPSAAKKGYLALANATNILGEAEFIDVTPDDDNLQIYRFKKGDESILSMWMLDSSANVCINVGCESVTVTDWLGNAETVKTENGALMISATEKPVYISGDFSTYKVENQIFDLEENKLTVAKGEEIVLSLNRGNVLAEKAGSIVPDLPVGFSMKTSADFAADSDNIEIVLATDEAVTNGKFRTEFQIQLGADIIGSVNANIEIVDETDIDIKPVLCDTEGFSSWRIDISVKNNSRAKDISGKITVTEPEEYAGTVIEIPTLKFGESHTGSIEPGKSPENKLIPLNVKLETVDGTEKEFKREVSCLAAVKAKGEVKIDGVLGENEWDNSMKFMLDDTSKIHGFKGQGELEEYGGENDLSGFGYLKWDDDAFYMCVKIKDDIHVQTSSGSGIWQGDGLQFCIDPSRGEGIGVNNWHEIGIVVTNEGETHMWKWLSIPGIAGGEVKDYTGCAIRNEEDKTVTYEVKIPWKQLLPLGTNISAGNIIGFSVIANEDDAKGRDGWIQYMGGIGDTKNAHRFGDVILLDDVADKTLSDSQYPWADIAANALYKRGIISADYSGARPVTKSEFIDMTAKVTGIEKEELSEVINGDEVITRQDMVVIMDKVYKIDVPADVEILKTFADHEQISDYAVQSFANLVKEGIIAGDGVNLYPQNNSVLSEVAVAVYNLTK